MAEPPRTCTGDGTREEWGRSGPRVIVAAIADRISVPALAAILVVGAITGAAIAWPLIRSGVSGVPGAAEPASTTNALEDDLERSLAAIKEIAFDHDAGNLSDDDFAELDASERARAVGIMREIDEAP